MCTEKDIPEYDYWQYVQYPCPLSDLPIILKEVIGSWERVMDIGDRVHPISRVGRVIEEMLDQIIDPNVNWPYLLWMDKNGNLRFFHFPYDKNQMYQFHFQSFFVAGMPAGILNFMEGGEVCTICTLYPFEDDLKHGKMYSRKMASKLFPEFRQLNHLTSLTNFQGNTASICDGIVTSVSSPSGPAKYTCFWAWSDYIYVYQNTNSAVINFVCWILSTAKDAFSAEDFDNMMAGVIVDGDPLAESVRQKPVTPIVGVEPYVPRNPDDIPLDRLDD